MRCIDCVHCDTKSMKCYPHSKDCEQEYILEEKDLYTDSICDFAERKENAY